MAWGLKAVQVGPPREVGLPVSHRMMDATSVLPNPSTSLAWLPPSIASELEVARYMLVALYSVGGTTKAFKT